MSTAVVQPLRLAVDPASCSPAEVRAQDAAIVAALRSGHPSAPARLFDIYGLYVERLLVRVLGTDPEIEDLLHEVFATALASISKLRDPQALKPWLARITVLSARGCIRRRRRGRWLYFMPHDEVPEQESRQPDPETQSTVARVYQVLGKLRTDDSVAFVLRELHGMTLEETADACDVSLATIKRRIKRARAEFMTAARQDPVLRSQLEANDG